MQSNIFSRKAVDYAITLTQIMAYVVFSRFLRYFFRSVNSISDNIGQLKKGSLIISNHQSVLDPFLILARLPFCTFIKVLPVRFPTSHEYYTKLRFFSILGCYDIGNTKKDKMANLFRTRQYLIDRKTIMLFPEGKICASNDLSDFHLGVTFFVDVAENIVFVKMVGFQRSNWLAVWNPQRQLIFSPVYEYSEEFKNIDVVKNAIDNLALENSYSN